MPAYVIAEVTIQNEQEMEEYKKLTPPTIAAYDGKFLVRGGETITLEGEWNPERIVVLEFPSAQLANEWWHSQQYSAAKVIRQSAAYTKMIIVEGVQN